MSNFYEKKVSPVFGDTSAAPEGYLGVVQAVDDFIGQRAELQKRNQEALFHANYNNAAHQAAVEAYNANPTDIEGYKRTYRELMGKIDVPLSQQARAGAINANVEAQYFWTINQNQNQRTRENLKSVLSLEADNYVENGISFMDGQLADPLPPASAGNQFRDATATLFSTYADGERIFSDGEVAAKTDQWNEKVLRENMIRSINSGAAVEDLVQILEPDFDYTVEVATDEGPLKFQKKDLSSAAQNRFNSAAAERVTSVIKTSNDSAALEYAQQIWRGDVRFFSADKKDRAALEKLADAQIARDPITAETFQGHMDNCQRHLERYHFLPQAYARVINGLVLSRNPRAAAMGATLLTRAIDVSPQAAKGFNDEAVLRSRLIHTQIQGGTTAENALARADKALDPSGRAGMEFLRQSLKDQKNGKNRDKFYGKHVRSDVYGPNGVQDYERMVDDFFLLTGGDRDSAVKTAQARMDAEYAETHIGADRHWRMPFFGAKRRKFKNTPEAVYGANSSSIINLDLESMAPAIAKMSGIPCDLDHIILIPTPETDRAVELGEDPTWRILRRNDDGTSQFYTDEDGNPLVYSLSEGVQREIYLKDLQIAKTEREENPGFRNSLNFLVDRIITQTGREAFENLPSWVLGGLSKAVEKGFEFATGTRASADVIGKLYKENQIRVAHSVIGVIRKAWENPDRRKGEMDELLKFNGEVKAPEKVTKKRKEWDAARRNGE